MEGFLIVIS